MFTKSIKIIIITLILLILLMSSSYFIFFLTNTMTNDAKSINYAGLVRGSIQRVSKLESNGIKSDSLINGIDDIIENFDWTNLRITRENSKFAETLAKVDKSWAGLKEIIYTYRQEPTENNKKEIISSSEAIWIEADKLVSLVQGLSENKLYYMKLIFPFLIINILLILLIIVLLKSYVQDTLEVNITIDSLTKIYNRNYFYSYLNKEIFKTLKHNNKMALILFDIDHFKKVNDNYGHDIGDYVLREISDIIRRNIRKSDVFARVGGEEFAIIVPQAGVDDAFNRAEKLRKIIELHNFNRVGNLTISLGVTEIAQEDTIDTLFKRADIAMYNAKNNGRNRVETVV